MDGRIRVLGIAPYEGMHTLMASLSRDYPQIELTLLTGDREEGLEAARNRFHGDYDAVISRGGTASILRANLPLPVVEIEFSLADILGAIHLAKPDGGRVAIISASDISGSVDSLKDYLDCEPEVFTYDNEHEAEGHLRKLHDDGLGTFICDNVAHTIARRLGIDSFLITASADSIRKAFDEVLTLSSNTERLRNENLFFRELLVGRSGQTLVFDPEGGLYLSTAEKPADELLSLLIKEIPAVPEDRERSILRHIGEVVYSIQAKMIRFEGRPYTAFFVHSSKVPLAPGRMGIKYSTRPEEEAKLDAHVFALEDLSDELDHQIDRISLSGSPVMISGEYGTDKEAVAATLYLRGLLSDGPFVHVNLSTLNERSLMFLLEHHNSPIYDEDISIYFSNIDALNEEKRAELLAVLSESETARRNQLYFSCVTAPGEYISAAGQQFTDGLDCLTLYLTPLRQKAEEIPTLINLVLSQLNAGLDRHIVNVEPAAVEILKSFGWPHNYTQFRRVMEELAFTSPGSVITAEHARAAIKKERHSGTFAPRVEDASMPLDLNRPMSDIQRDIALRVVAENGGRQTAAAKSLGISRTTLWRLLQKEP